ncbi:hypothetical protein FXO38_07158 [Capsicum annuum]|nr:hypothetical protein FXO38_07158 [Capsicum annuum]
MLDNAPSVVVFHLKRFQNDGSVVQKVDKCASFLLESDFLPHSDHNNQTNNEEMKYDLYAVIVIVHAGFTSSSGHYYSFIRPAPNDWYKFDDLESHDALIIDEFYDTLLSKEKIKHLVNGSKTQGDSLIDRGMTHERNSGGDDRFMLKSRNRNKTYNYCKKKGHIKFECYKVQNIEKRETLKLKENQPEKFGEASFVEDSNSDGELLVVSNVSKGVVLMGNNTPCKIVGIGTIRIKMFDGVVMTLGDVRYVPDLKRNLFSLSTLDWNRYRYTGEGGVSKVTKGAIIVMKGQSKTTNLYVLQGSMIKGDSTISTSSLLESDVTKFWHMCLGHMSENEMAELSVIVTTQDYPLVVTRCS